MKLKPDNDRQGFSLISVVFAMSMVLIGALALISVLPVGLKSMVRSQQRGEAQILIQKQLEAIKRMGTSEFYRVTGSALTRLASPYNKYYTETLVDYMRRDVTDVDGDGNTEDFVPTANITNMKRVTMRIYLANANGGVSSTIISENTAFISGIMPNIMDNIPPALGVFASPNPTNGDITITVTSDELLGAAPTVSVTQQGATAIDAGSFNYAGYTGGAYLYTCDYIVINGAGTDGLATLYATGVDGSSNIAYATGSFTVDTTPPVITNIYSNNCLAGTADIHWEVNEGGAYEVHYGTLTPSFIASDTETAGAVSRTLTGLMSGTTYHYYLTVSDAAGNLATADNGGSLYSFTTQSLTNISMTLSSQAGADTDGNYLPGSTVRILITESNGAVGLETLGSNITITGATAGTVVSQAALTAGGGGGQYYYDWINTGVRDTYTVTVYLTDGVLNSTGSLVVTLSSPSIQISSLGSSVGADTDGHYEPNTTVRILAHELNNRIGLETLGSTLTITTQTGTPVISDAGLTAGPLSGDYYYDWPVSTEDTYIASVTLTDGYTSATSNTTIYIISGQIVLAGNVTRTNLSGYDRIEFDARNDASSNITIKAMRVEWTRVPLWNPNNPPNLTKVYAPVTYTIKSSPPINSPSGFNLDSNVTFSPGQVIRFRLKFNDTLTKNMAGATTTVYMIDLDSKEYVLGPMTTP